MAREQDNRLRVQKMTRRAIKTSSFIIMPLMMGMAICAEPLVLLILTEKWRECVPFLRVFCFTYAFYPIHTANLNAIKAMGRSDLVLKLEIIKKTIGIVAILISMHFGVLWMAYSLVITSLVNQVVNAYPNRKLLDYSYGKQILDILPALLLASVMGAAVYCVSFLHLPDLLTMCIQVPLGVVIYVGGAWLLKLEAFAYIAKMLRDILKRQARKQE
jgi:O-antigen/teichoic acid export membrane protein